MAKLPAPATLPAWRKRAVIGLWTAAGIGAVIAFPGAYADVAREYFRVVAGHPVSLAQIVTTRRRAGRRQLDRNGLGAAARLGVPSAFRSAATGHGGHCSHGDASDRERVRRPTARPTIRVNRAEAEPVALRR